MPGKIFSSAFGDTIESVERGIKEIMMEPFEIIKLESTGKTATPVTKFDEELQHFALRMSMTIKSVTWGNCVGLAANQVGDDRAFFIAENIVYVNPEIIWKSSAPANRSREGCYSLRENEYFTIDRAPSITIRWQDLLGNWHERRRNGFNAAVIQLENDHLLGKLCSGE